MILLTIRLFAVDFKMENQKKKKRKEKKEKAVKAYKKLSNVCSRRRSLQITIVSKLVC